VLLQRRCPARRLGPDEAPPAYGPSSTNGGTGDEVLGTRADALQSAAAFVAADWSPASLEVITLDDRLAIAARKEGFAVVDVPA
jgi:hypothetical protein